MIPYTLSPGQQNGRITASPIPLYKLVTPKAATSYAGPSPHTNYTFGSPSCALCHQTHDALSRALLPTPSQSGICFTCHDNSGGASTNIEAQFNVPANDESTDTYYSHPVNDASTSLHLLETDDSFAGVLNRHSLCADCHNPHNATSGRPVQTTTGWTAPGNIKGVTAVAVTNGSGGSAPTYTLLGDGQAVYEYQLCVQCHSSYTTLPTRATDSPSWWALDAAIEFNPANNAVHPIEARGRNLTTEMAGSLAGTSPFKAWNYTLDSTLRCASCHGDPSTVNQTASSTPLTPNPADPSAPHASQNRGLLIAPYRDRTLMAQGEAYNSANFALCYLCHAERPFIDTNGGSSQPDTNFPFHGSHMQQISRATGLGNSIDTPGAGDGLAICAECHFRVHSTAIAYKVGDTAPVARTTGYQSLVNFSPNVQGLSQTSSPVWRQPDSTGVGYCAMVCHGYQHTSTNTTYTVAPAAGFYATVTSGPVGPTGLAVSFVDASRYLAPTSGTWAWTFGDGGTSTAVNPTHVYTVAGTYTVTLTVTRTSGDLSSALTRTGYITVTP